MINSLKKYKEKLPNDPKLFLIIVLVLTIIIIAIWSNFKGKMPFEIEDKCGKFINVFSHTIEDENVCKTRCRAQCGSLDYKYKKVEFKKSNTGCNFCKCYCK